MIQVDVVLAIAIVLSLFLAVVFVLWIFYNFRGDTTATPADTVEKVQQCPYCTCVFISYKQGEVLMCPRCKSYIGSTPFAG